MKEIGLDVLKDAANRLMFDLTDEELTSLQGEFKILLAQMEKVDAVDGMGEFEPMTFPFPNVEGSLREDEPEEPLSIEEALRNSGSVQDGQIKLPKVVS